MVQLLSNQKENEQYSQQKYYCPECQMGLMQIKRITYFTWLNGELITVPNFPAWVCDLCGRRDYDYRAITWLNTILHPETGRKVTAKRKLPKVSTTTESKESVFPE